MDLLLIFYIEPMVTYKHYKIMKNDFITILSPSDFSASSGDVSNFKEMLNQFLVEGLKVLLICPKNPKDMYPYVEDLQKNLEIIKINYFPPRLIDVKGRIHIKRYLEFLLFLIIETITVLRIIRTRKIKSIYVRHSILTMQLPFILKLFRIKILADGEIISDTVHDILNPLFFRIFSKYEKKIFKCYSYFKVSSQSQVKNLIELGYPSNRVVIIPVSINTDKMPTSDLERIPEHTFGYFGGLEQWQRIDILIEAFKLVVEKIPQAILYIIGNGSLRKKLEELTISNNLTENIIFVDKISREKLWECYFTKFRIVIIPRQKLNNSIDTILPIKLVEALAAFKPIIAIDIPVMRELNGNPILLVPSGDPLSLATAMYSLSTNFEELKQRSILSGNSSKNYDIRINIKKIISILKE
jgi:glycosyltransferase involved in cell wall biosynthesis